jgi:hypothetical protein
VVRSAWEEKAPDLDAILQKTGNILTRTENRDLIGTCSWLTLAYRKEVRVMA